MLLRGPVSTTKEGGATVLLRGSQQLFVSLRTYEKCIDCLERDMNASDARCARECAAAFVKDGSSSCFHVRALSWRGRWRRRQGRGALRSRCHCSATLDRAYARAVIRLYT